MDVVGPILLGIFVLIVTHFSYYGSVTKQIEPGISNETPVYASQVVTALENKKPSEPHLPEFIKKDRTVEYRYQWEWRREWVALLQANCSNHFGKDRCNDCETYDHNVPVGCDCDMIYQRNMAEEVLLRFRAPNDNCQHHSKEHHFA